VFDQLFDRDRKPVGWTDGRYVFDCDSNWVAFATQGHAFSASDLAWLGPVDGHSYLDRRGKVVAWSPLRRPVNSRVATRPGRPIRPTTPPKPLVGGSRQPGEPVPPIGGWSGQSFDEWRAQTW
jgi:4-fold beta flower protein